MIRTSFASLVFALAACDIGPVEDERDAGASAGEGGTAGADESDDGEDAGEAQELSERDAEILAEVAADAGDGASDESALVATVAIAASDAREAGASSGEALADAAADSTTIAGLCPGGGFATATAQGNAATFNFVNCTSHCGLVRATGHVKVFYDVIDNGVGVDIEAEDFRINGARTDLSVSAQYTRSGTLDAIAIDTDATVTGWFGYQITRVGSYEATFDTSTLCTTHDGSWTTTFGQSAGYRTTVDGYRRCALQCPDQGSRIELATLDEAHSIEAQFTTPTTLEWSTSAGWAGTLEIPICGQ